MLNRFVVEGSYAGGNDGYPITRDYVVAENADAACELVEQVRDSTDYEGGWTPDRAISFEDAIAEMRQEIAELAALSVDAITQTWEETKDSLGYEEEAE